MKSLIAFCLAIGVTLAVVIALWSPSPKMVTKASADLVPAQAAQQAVPEPASPPISEQPNPGSVAPEPKPLPTEKAVNKPKLAQPRSANAPPAMRPGKEISDPAARVALSFVGADPDAEEYWIGAINDPSLSANERKDLIEDLNEDGFPDPKRPGPQDLPIIINRLLLIEDLAPYAMDQVNADAFMEAYKDLNNMLEGKPVP